MGDGPPRPKLGSGSILSHSGSFSSLGSGGPDDASKKDRFKRRSVKFVEEGAGAEAVRPSLIAQRRLRRKSEEDVKISADLEALQSDVPPAFPEPDAEQRRSHSKGRRTAVNDQYRSSALISSSFPAEASGKSIGFRDAPSHILAASLSGNSPSSVVPSVSSACFRLPEVEYSLYTMRTTGDSWASSAGVSFADMSTRSPSPTSQFSGSGSSFHKKRSLNNRQRSRETLKVKDDTRSSSKLRPHSKDVSKVSKDSTVKKEEDPVTVLFQNPMMRRAPHMLQFLWEEIKKRILSRHGSLEVGWRVADTDGGGTIDYCEFNDLLKDLNLDLEPKFGKTVFQQACCGEPDLSFEQFEKVVMQGTLLRMMSCLRRFDNNKQKVSLGVEHFLYVLTYAHENNKRQSAARFQRKFSIEFFRAFHEKLNEYCAKLKIWEVDSNIFWKIMSSTSVRDTTIQKYEIDIVRAIFQRIDRFRLGKVHILDLCTFLVILSGETDRRAKLETLFGVFDGDDDKCLTHHQVLVMLCSICLHRPLVAGDQEVADADMIFNDELGLQEGKRLFDSVLQHIELKHGRQPDVAKDIICFEELMQTFEDQPSLLDVLLPGTYNLRWALADRPSSKQVRYSVDGASPPGTAASRGLHRSDSRGSKMASRESSRGSRVGSSSAKPWTASSGGSSCAVQLLNYYGQRPQTGEQFSISTKRGFRQALRGDWFAVQERVDTFDAYHKVLTEARPCSQGGSGPLGQTAESVPWRVGLPLEVPDDNSKKADWTQKHKGTLVEWVKEAQIPDHFSLHLKPTGDAVAFGAGRRGSMLTRSQSEPGLNRTICGPQGASRLPLTRLQKFPTLNKALQEERPGTRDIGDNTELPPISDMRWGKKACFFANRCSCARTSKYMVNRLSQTVSYKCTLCVDNHSMVLRPCS